MSSRQTWCNFFLPTCEEFEGRFSLWAHYFDLAEKGEGNTVGWLGESLDVPAEPGLRVPKLATGESQDVEVRGAQLPVQLLQRPVVRLRLLAVTRHVYNQRRLNKGKTGIIVLMMGLYGITSILSTESLHQKTIYNVNFHEVCTDLLCSWYNWWWCGLTFPRYLSRETVLPFASLTSKE